MTGRRPSERLPRLTGWGSVFAKTVHDSRGAMTAVFALLALMIVAGGEVMSTTYGSPEARSGLGALASDIPPSLRGLYGDPLNVDTLGGFISWHYGSYFALVAGLWSIFALSATLAVEARRGSLDLVIAARRSRRRVALEKVGGHLVGLGLVAAALGVVAWVTGEMTALSSRDAIPPDAALAFVVGLVARSLVAGSIGFALAAFLGRAVGAGIAGAIMLAGYVLYGYRTVVPAFDGLARLTWWSWTAGHVPLAGSTNWPGVAVTIAIAALAIVVGIEGFARRDIGVTLTTRLPTLPDAVLGVRGPISRAFGELLPGAAWWGIGLGLYGATMAVASESIADMLIQAPAIAEAFRSLLPGFDLTTAAGFLQLAFIDFGFALVGLAAATFVGGRWADESSGRLEVLLATPLSRSGWAVATGVAAWLAVVVLTAVLAVSIGAGIALVGQHPLAPAIGIGVLALYGWALVGVGMAVGGTLGPSIAAPLVVALAIGTFLLDTLAPILRLPDWISQMALTTHLGEPMVGRWDGAGVVACIALAVVGLAVGALGMRRRDVAA